VVLRTTPSFVLPQMAFGPRTRRSLQSLKAFVFCIGDGTVD
jgi:hypothetical protein